MRQIITTVVLGLMGLVFCGGTARAEEQNLQVNEAAFTKYFEVQKFKLDDTTDKLTWIVKAKVKVTVTTAFRVEFRDEDGVVIETVRIDMTPAGVGFDVGQVMRATAKMPRVATLEKTKSVVVVGGILR